ncbi:B3 domain-containing protein REM5-like isoform X3 [Salvia miltiorrhiza]|uniref:B3 domain-containing protein REM5-like isoform X3 n=1 Tax=Salvia miltiorrhiza TaxID=226208 RepID=UPI0025AD7AF3|nr:B3 domain-containing protein REM5-like isoform X3 [Salvia miltiorrhiza]
MEGKHGRSITKDFFKVLMPGFHQKLSLPPIVSKELEKQKSRRVILESRIGKWRVSLCRNHENGLICLNQGWPQFVDRHALKLGEFVVFEHTGDLNFNVSVYKTNFCENEFDDEEEEEGTEALIPLKQSKEEEGTEQSTMKEEEEEEEEDMFFEKTMKARHATKWATVNIPFAFLRSNNLGMQRRDAVLRDPRSGREWDVKILAERGVWFRMRKGWYAFYESNNLKDGDRCVFRLNRRLLTSTTIVFDVEIIRAK